MLPRAAVEILQDGLFLGESTRVSWEKQDSASEEDQRLSSEAGPGQG